MKIWEFSNNITWALVVDLFVVMHTMQCRILHVQVVSVIYFDLALLPVFSRMLGDTREA